MQKGIICQLVEIWNQTEGKVLILLSVLGQEALSLGR